MSPEEQADDEAYQAALALRRQQDELITEDFLALASFEAALQLEPRMDKIVWIPEAPKHPGLYALPEAHYSSDGKLGLTRTYGTHAAHEAVQHETREECQRWCDAFHEAHPEVADGRAWEPREHGFVS